MKARLIASMALALLVVSLSMASAQGGRRGMMRGGGLQLLRLPEVQKELKMTPAQIEKIDAKQQDVRQAIQDAFQGGNPQDLSDEDRQKAMTKVQEIQSKAVADILDEKQLKRFHQLEWQQQGTLAVTRKEVAGELKLSEEQLTKIRQVQRQMEADLQAARQGVNFQNLSEEERGKLTTKTQEIQKTAGEKVEAVLTEKQKKQWKEMLGEPFKFPAPGPRRAAP